MSDLSGKVPQMPRHGKRLRHSTTEYRFYLGLIFLAALPFCTVIWAYNFIRSGNMPGQGPLQSALSEARAITPCIFWN